MPGKVVDPGAKECLTTRLLKRVRGVGGRGGGGGGCKNKACSLQATPTRQCCTGTVCRCECARLVPITALNCCCGTLAAVAYCIVNHDNTEREARRYREIKEYYLNEQSQSLIYRYNTLADPSRPPMVDYAVDP
ncbi:uncharacterized protein LOC134846040 isoform X2 [Symsagittifera roscoffensis]|uniref:uncharacterized protein LOC134846040 isoform X2 n=1 Tax=Symsagittifera roscoffensis TaxID=84072 RepID=UPI00307B60B5